MEEQQTRSESEASLSNEELIGMIKKIETGSSSALMSFYDATSRLVFGLILKVLGERTAAEETLLEVYTRIWKQSACYDPAATPVEWLAATAHACAIARMHWAKREGAKQEKAPGMVDSPVTVDPERQTLARSTLQSMAAGQRELLELAYYGGLSCSEIAARMGKPVGAVKTHIRLGLSQLAESFSQGNKGKTEAAAAQHGGK